MRNQPLRIGNQTAWSAKTLFEPFEYALANGFDAFEWFPDKKESGAGWDGSDLDSSQRAEVRQAAAAAGVRLSVHARCAADILDPEVETLLERDLELAEALGAVLINVHLNVEQGIEAFVRALAPWCGQVARSGRQLSIENTPATTPAQFNALFSALAVAMPRSVASVGMCLDVGHANLCPATRNDYLAYLDQLGPHVPIIHLHFHENWGDADSHLTLFTGPSGTDSRGIGGLLRRLRRRRYTGSVILEQWPQPHGLLNDARNRLREMWDDLETPEFSAASETHHL